ncbi:MAG: protease modulator HflC [Deferrisomatales bacterium]|nr:protease modulator HflC [Deferrisomatales bacterium]
MEKLLRIVGIVAVVVALVLATPLNPFFVVEQIETALVLQLGKPVGEIRGPGLHVRIPLVQSVSFYDTRYQVYDAEAREVITSDKKNLLVDNYARWRITDPLKFYQTVRDARGAQARLDDIIYSQVREQLGKYDLIASVATKRAQIMAEVTQRTAESAKEYGIEVVDVRIKRADLPPANQQAVYARMQAERHRQAQLYRSEGERDAQSLRAEADKQKAVILAEAYRLAEVQKGKGDAEAAGVYAAAYGKDREFYGFVRSLEMYRQGFKDGDILMLSPDDELFRYVRGSGSGK